VSSLATVSLRALGTTAVLATSEPAALRAARGVFVRGLRAFDLACSRFRDDSELAVLNRNAGTAVPVGELLWDAVSVAIRAAETTGGLVDPTIGRPLRLADTALAVEGLISSPGDTVVGFYENCMTHERTDALKILDGIPTHVLVGTRDVLTPPPHARRIADHVEGAVLTVVPDAGHMLPLERDELVSGVLIRLVRPLL